MITVLRDFYSQNLSPSPAGEKNKKSCPLYWTINVFPRKVGLFCFVSFKSEQPKFCTLISNHGTLSPLCVVMRANSRRQLLDTPACDVGNGPEPPAAGTGASTALAQRRRGAGGGREAPGRFSQAAAAVGALRPCPVRGPRPPQRWPRLRAPSAGLGSPGPPRWGAKVRRERRARPGSGEGRRPDPSVPRGCSAAPPGPARPQPPRPARTCPAAPPPGPSRSPGRVPPWGPAARGRPRPLSRPPCGARGRQRPAPPRPGGTHRR